MPIAVYVAVGFCFPGGEGKLDGVELLTQIGLPTLIAFLATLLIMGKQGRRAFWRALIISLVMSFIFIAADQLWHWETPFFSTLIRSWVWGLNSPWSVAAASAVIALYLIINAAFLQSYLGDAARYFRNSPANVAVRRTIRKEAVDTLQRLHNGQYDRIVVVAHSLGTVVAYDMLRAYFSRVSGDLPPVAQLGQDFADIDNAAWQPKDKDASIEDKKALRTKARAVIAEHGRCDGRPAARCTPKELAGDRLCHARKRADPRLLSDVSGQDARRARRGHRSRRQGGHRNLATKSTSKPVSSAISLAASGKENSRPARRSGLTMTAC